MSAWEIAYKANRKVFYEAATDTIRQCPENYCLAHCNGKWRPFLDAASPVKLKDLLAVLTLANDTGITGDELARLIEESLFG